MWRKCLWGFTSFITTQTFGVIQFSNKDTPVSDRYNWLDSSSHKCKSLRASECGLYLANQPIEGVPVKYEVTSFDHWTRGALDEWLAVALEESRHISGRKIFTPYFPIKKMSTTPFNYPSTLPFWIYFLDILSREKHLHMSGIIWKVK